MRDMFHPDRMKINVVELERARLTWHRPALAQAEEDRVQATVRKILDTGNTNPDYADPARLHLTRAIGLGVSFFPLVDDQAGDLPYSVITIPLNEA